MTATWILTIIPLCFRAYKIYCGTRTGVCVTKLMRWRCFLRQSRSSSQRQATVKVRGGLVSQEGQQNLAPLPPCLGSCSCDLRHSTHGRCWGTTCCPVTLGLSAPASPSEHRTLEWEQTGNHGSSQDVPAWPLHSGSAGTTGKGGLWGNGQGSSFPLLLHRWVPGTPHQPSELQLLVNQGHPASQGLPR